MATLRIAVAVLLLSLPAFGQGAPSFHTIVNNGVDSIDLGTMVTFVNAPIRTKSAGAEPFAFLTNINSGFIVDNLTHLNPIAATTTAAGVGTVFQSSTAQSACGQQDTVYTYTYTDENGTIHALPVTWNSTHCLTEVSQAF